MKKGDFRASSDTAFCLEEVGKIVKKSSSHFELIPVTLHIENGISRDQNNARTSAAKPSGTMLNQR
jgi:hypothetical protein